MKFIQFFYKLNPIYPDIFGIHTAYMHVGTFSEKVSRQSDKLFKVNWGE